MVYWQALLPCVVSTVLEQSAPHSRIVQSSTLVYASSHFVPQLLYDCIIRGIAMFQQDYTRRPSTGSSLPSSNYTEGVRVAHICRWPETHTEIYASIHASAKTATAKPQTTRKSARTTPSLLEACPQSADMLSTSTVLRSREHIVSSLCRRDRRTRSLHITMTRMPKPSIASNVNSVLRRPSGVEGYRVIT